MAMRGVDFKWYDGFFLSMLATSVVIVAINWNKYNRCPNPLHIWIVAWRLWSQPDSLLSQVLRHRYFPNTSFLESNLGSRPSYARRSILHGREVLAQGLMKKIGNGKDTKVWLENWLMDVIPRAPRYTPTGIVDLTLTVADLIDHQTNQWQLARSMISFFGYGCQKLRLSSEVATSFLLFA